MKIKEHFSSEEIQQFCRRSDLLGWTAVATNWAIIGFAFVLVARWPNPFTIVLAMILLGGRHLGLGVLMHECGHGTLFRSKTLNRFVGSWLCAAPVMYRLDDYMSNHLSHHSKAGTNADPDLYRYQHYPVEKKSLQRKLLRDVSGQTSLNFLKTSLERNQVITTSEEGKRILDYQQLFSCFYAPIIMNSLLFLLLMWFGFAELYLLWLAAYFSVYMVFSRIRNLAEHACVPDLLDPDPMLHTRTMVVSWWERLTFAPNCVNYHLEHHLLPSVPKYRLASFHAALKGKGLLANADIESGYLAFIRKLIIEPQSACTTD
ncbi:MAG: fatty acid desaturase [Pseudohongiellaceae bacterium]